MSRSWPVVPAVTVLLMCTTLQADTLSTHSVFYQELSWSPDGTKLALTAMVDQKPADVYSIILKGKIMTKLTSSDAYDGWTCWSKDGSQIYFTSSRDGNDELYVMRADGNGVRRLTTSPARDVAPSLSPDGTQIVFISERDGNPDVYTSSIDGTQVRRLTTTPAREYNPQWSPDGANIACYASTEGQKDKVWIINVGTGDAKVVGSDTTKNTYASWAADAQSVIYGCSPAEGEKWIYSATLDGSKNEKLLPLPAFYAKYAPDGKRIAYIGGSWPSSNVYVIDYTDGTLRCLTCDLQLGDATADNSKDDKSKKR